MSRELELPISIHLPWPAKELSPNAKLHWARVAKFKKEARWMADVIVGSTDAMFHGSLRTWARNQDEIRITCYFHPPANYRYDRDNLMARMKASLDGIADGLGVDDRVFRPQAPVLLKARKLSGVAVLIG